MQKLEKEVEKQLRIIQVYEQQEATLLKVPRCWPAERKYVNLIKGWSAQVFHIIFDALNVHLNFGKACGDSKLQSSHAPKSDCLQSLEQPRFHPLHLSFTTSTCHVIGVSSRSGDLSICCTLFSLIFWHHAILKGVVAQEILWWSFLEHNFFLWLLFIYDFCLGEGIHKSTSRDCRAASKAAWAGMTPEPECWIPNC